ncbi:MAG: TetR/AcrR family transcriptional regulator [Phycisphaerales bacterium]
MAPLPNPSPRPTARDRLIERAADLFGRHGFAPIGLDRIIADVGVTKTTFYNHFASKDELVIAVLAVQHETQTAELIADLHTRAGDDPRAQVLAIFNVFDDWFQDPEFNGCIFMNAATEYPIDADPVHRAAVAHAAELHAFIAAKCAAAGVDPAEAPDAAAQLYLLLAGALIMRQTAKRRDAAAIAKRAAESLLSGLLAHAR